jgi:HD superfamily phosphodiesterase
MTSPSVLREVERFVESYCARLDFAHDVEHVRRVVEHAKSLAGDEGGDPDLVELGAWLHQLHDDLYTLEVFLEDVGLEAGLRKALFRIVRDCRPDRIRDDSTLEAKIVFDADAMEVLGPYGTIRELLCNACAREKNWHKAVADTRRAQQEFAAALRTASAKKRARSATSTMKRFWEIYDRWSELSG